MSRYKVVPISQSFHCCFTHTVVDTTKPDMVGEEQYVQRLTGEPQFESVCECTSEEDANLICKALNLYEKVPQ